MYGHESELSTKKSTVIWNVSRCGFGKDWENKIGRKKRNGGFTEKNRRGKESCEDAKRREKTIGWTNCNEGIPSAMNFWGENKW